VEGEKLSVENRTPGISAAAPVEKGGFLHISLWNRKPPRRKAFRSFSHNFLLLLQLL